MAPGPLPALMGGLGAGFLVGDPQWRGGGLLREGGTPRPFWVRPKAPGLNKKPDWVSGRVTCSVWNSQTPPKTNLSRIITNTNAILFSNAYDQRFCRSSEGVERTNPLRSHQLYRGGFQNGSGGSVLPLHNFFLQGNPIETHSPEQKQFLPILRKDLISGGVELLDNVFHEHFVTPKLRLGQRCKPLHMC